MVLSAAGITPDSHHHAMKKMLKVASLNLNHGEVVDRLAAGQHPSLSLAGNLVIQRHLHVLTPELQHYFGAAYK
jgi:hypothetical protein